MRTDGFTLDDFNFHLPPELIAQYPEQARDESRLFVLNRHDGTHVHSAFSRLPEFLKQGDVLVLNDTKVISARIPCKRSSGGVLELLLTGRLDAARWTGITNRTKRCKAGETLYPVNDPSIGFIIIKKSGGILELKSNRELADNDLDNIGSIALPPYIRRDAAEEDRVRYQTVYARESGAIAAPTAGLHFTDGLLASIRDRGVQPVFLTLHVSWGTFQPVREDDISLHQMHSEKYVLSDGTAEIINRARNGKGRIIAVGTTSLRVLESTFHGGMNIPGAGETDIFIYPPRRVLSADCLITNFHTPRSTLLMLVASFAGYDAIMAAYREAVREKYRFFSYGDAMLIL